MDELFASGIKLEYTPDYNLIFEIGDESEVPKLQRILEKNSMKSYSVCLEWRIYHKSASIFISDFLAELNYANINLYARTLNP